MRGLTSVLTIVFALTIGFVSAQETEAPDGGDIDNESYDVDRLENGLKLLEEALDQLNVDDQAKDLFKELVKLKDELVEGCYQKAEGKEDDSSDLDELLVNQEQLEVGLNVFQEALDQSNVEDWVKDLFNEVIQLKSSLIELCVQQQYEE